MPNVTVADSSCLILLSKIGQIELLKKLFGELTITKTVAEEFNKPLPAWIKVVTSDSGEIKGLASTITS
jgi:predicted nucleic acid-binding protein